MELCSSIFLQETGIVEPSNNPNTSQQKQNAKTEIRDSPRTQEGSDPPLIRALQASAEQNTTDFHFPGHNKGRAAPSSLTQLIGLKPFIHDLPPLPELDKLFHPHGPILEVLQQALNFLEHQRHGSSLEEPQVEFKLQLWQLVLQANT